MGIASYHRVYRRALPTREAGCLRNPACRLTDQGADPDPGDLAWCIRRAWRVIHWGSTPTLNRAVVLAGRACVLQKSRMTIEQGRPGQRTTAWRDRRRGDKSCSFTEVH